MGAPPMTRVAIALRLTLALAVASCATAPPPPAPPPLTEPLGEYVIEPGDVLTLRFERNKELDEEALIVRPDGKISPLLIAEVQAAGLTPAALSAELAQRYATELAHPRVAVGVKKFTSHRVSVAGEVEEPKVLPLDHGLTLLQAIHHAGGFLKSANRGQVVLIRHHRDGHVTGHTVDLDKTEVGMTPEHDVRLQPLDQIYVPRSQIANINVVVEQYIRNNVPVNSLGIGITPF